MSSIFISHSSKDNDWAVRLQKELASQGHNSVFLDIDPEQGIQAGVSWERTLYTKLRSCRAVVALVSKNYLVSQWCFAEIALARMEGKDLFVLQVDPWDEETEMPSILTEEQFIDLRTDPEDGFKRLWNGFRAKNVVPAEAREWSLVESPYPGLRPFTERDAPIFFGRDDELREGIELLNRMRRQGSPKLAMVLGSSGSGKSSLVRAGLVPSLKKDKAQWVVVPAFRPGESPLEQLVHSISRLSEKTPNPIDEATLREQLSTASLGTSLPKLLRDVLSDLDQPEASPVLVVDQFEELMGFGPDHQNTKFLADLRELLDGDATIVVLATMRSDYFGAFQEQPQLRGLATSTLSLGPMSREGMRQVIEEPAKLGQVQLEKNLADILLDDTERSDALPLLAFTLRMMWERDHETHRLEIARYRAFGGLHGAVAQVADETLETALTLGSERELHDSFIRLARPNPDGSGWVRRSLSWDRVPEPVRPMLQKFIDQRLLVKSGEGTLEVAHEALFRSWDRLRGWLDENAEGLRLLDEIHVTAEKWEAAASDKDREPYLWRGGRLARASELQESGNLALGELEKRFVQASTARDRRRKRFMQTLVASLAVLAVAAVAGAFVANQARTSADIARSVAEQRSDQAEELIGFMLGDLREKLTDVGKLDVLDDVGVEAMKYFASLGDDLSGADALNRVVAIRQIGEVRFEQGQLEDAFDAFEQSRSYAVGLHDNFPDNNDFLYELGKSEFWLAYATRRKGDREAAGVGFMRSNELAKELVARAPDNFDYQVELAESTGYAAVAQFDKGDLARAIELYEHQEDLLREVSDQKPEDAELKRSIASNLAWQGNINGRLYRLADAEAVYELSISNLHEILAIDDDTKTRFSLSGRYASKAEASLHLGDVEGAKGALAKAYQTMVDLVDHDETNQHWQLRRHQIRQRQVLLSIATEPGVDNAEIARELYDESRAFFQSNPESGLFRRAFYRGAINLALELIKQGQQDQARAVHSEVFGQLEERVAKAEGDYKFRTGEIILYDMAAVFAAEKADAAQAQSYWRIAQDGIEAKRVRTIIDVALQYKVSSELGNFGQAAKIEEILTKAGFADPRYPYLQAN